MSRSELSGNALFHPLLAIAFLNVFSLFLVLIVFYSFFISPAGYVIRMPVTSLHSAISDASVTIRISPENVFFVEGVVVTSNDLKRLLLKANIEGGTVYVQVDVRASMKRVAEILEMCRGIGAAQVKISII